MGRDAAEQDLAREISKLSQAQLDKLMRVRDGASVPPEFWDEYAAEMQSLMLPALEKIYLDGAEGMLQETPSIGVDWALVNESAAQWARQYSFDLVKGITDTTRAAVGEKLAAYFENPSTIQDLTDSLESLFGPVRAEMIAATEATRAANLGTQSIVDELNKQGTQMYAVWTTAEDEIVCPICGPLDGTRQGDGWDELPPAHPRCRCLVVHRFEK